MTTPGMTVTVTRTSDNNNQSCIIILHVILGIYIKKPNHTNKMTKKTML